MPCTVARDSDEICRIPQSVLERTGSISAQLSSLDTAKKIAHLASDKKASDIVILAMNGVVNYCDYFVICTATSSRHVKAISDGIDEGLSELGIRIKYRQGLAGTSRPRPRTFSFANNPSMSPDESGGRWVLLDMGDIVTHIFEGSSREFYGLEHLWQEARKVDWE